MAALATHRLILGSDSSKHSEGARRADGDERSRNCTREDDRDQPAGEGLDAEGCLEA